MATTYLPIGDFARATQFSVRMLRHYHEIGLLTPAEADPQTGYRRYTPEQITRAQVIRRFRDLEMPLEQIRAVLSAPDLETRNRLINEHLDSLQAELAKTSAAVDALRDLLEPGQTERGTIGRRRVEATPAAVISEVIDIADALSWFEGAMAELHATVAAQSLQRTGPAGGFYADELFTDERGRATVFVPCLGTLRPAGRVAALIVPAAELATTLHAGHLHDIDRAYGALGSYVAAHALAVAGPIREYYLVSRNDTLDASLWRTELGWPVFHLTSATAEAR
jgi:DNA-binding transcriptional MerR regulator